MADEIDGVDEAGAEPAADSPSWATDALDALIGDDYSEEPAETPEGGPAAAAAQEPEGDEADPTDDGDPANLQHDADPTDDGEAPEELKEILKGLSRSQRGKILSHYRSQAEGRLKEAQEVESRTRSEQEAREATAREIREKRGGYIGEVETQRSDGTTVPTYQEIDRLLKVRGGDDILDDKFGLSRDEAQEQLEVWDERKKMLDGSLDDFRTDAWVESGKLLAASVAKAALPIDAIWKDVKGIGDVVPSVVAHLTAKHEAERAADKKEFEGRLRAATANGSAVAARTAAKTLPTPETGGRGDSSGARIYTMSELSDPAFFRANEADIDRALEEGRIAPD